MHECLESVALQYSPCTRMRTQNKREKRTSKVLRLHKRLKSHFVSGSDTFV